MRLVFFGTPDFAVPTLSRLCEGPHRVVLVVSQPDRPHGRGRVLRPSPVSRHALDAGLPLLRPQQVGVPDVRTAIAEQAPDLGVVVAFGQFLPRAVRELPSRGYLINAHASLLPRHRGAAPIQHALLAGDPETGISVMRVEREMDAGPVALVRRMPIAPDDDAGSLGERLSALAAEAIAEALEQITRDTVVWRAQDPAAATLAPKIERADTILDWHQPAALLCRRVRALAPSPGAQTRFAGEPLWVLAAETLAGTPDRPPGCVAAPEGEPLRVATGGGWLVPRRLQRPGGRVLDVDAFLRGRPIPDGAQLGV